MKDCITLTVPARVDALTVVRLTTAGVAACRAVDFDTLEDIKTAVYEACYAIVMQKWAPETLNICFTCAENLTIEIVGKGKVRETVGKLPDLALCNAVLTTMIPHVDVDMDKKGIRGIVMHD